MLLTAESAVEQLKLGHTGDPNGINIVPYPDLDEIAKKGGASIDLRLGRWFLTLRHSKMPVMDVDDEQQHLADAQRRYFVPFDDKFILHPGRFVLGSTLEWLRLPSQIAAYVTGKSSWGRRGLIIETAAGIHPGFSGCLALELANVGELPIALRPGMTICQIFLHQTTPGKPASSAFDGRRRPVLERFTA
ncbi:MAG TPA: dCTP deaminase [Stellaceae bacterium]|jgi:dCTP deaminase